MSASHPVVRALVVPVLGLSVSKKAASVNAEPKKKEPAVKNAAAKKTPATPKPGLAERIEESLAAKTPEAAAANAAVKKAENAIERVKLSRQPKIAALKAEAEIEKAGAAIDAAVAASHRKPKAKAEKKAVAKPKAEPKKKAAKLSPGTAEKLAEHAPAEKDVAKALEAERAEIACAAATAAHPLPKAGQVWSTPTPQGRSFMRIEEVRAKGTVDAYANFVRVTDASGAKIARKSKSSPFNGLLVSHKLVGKGEMEPSYRYEGEAATKREPAALANGEKAEKKAAAPKTPKTPKTPGEKKESPYINREGRRSASNEEIVAFIAKAKAKDPEVTMMDCLRAFITDNRFSSHMRFRPLFKSTKAAKA